MALRPGFHEHHDEACDLALRYERSHPDGRVRAHFCETHHQWAYERPVSATYSWADGSTTEVRSDRSTDGPLGGVGVDADSYRARR